MRRRWRKEYGRTRYRARLEWREFQLSKHRIDGLLVHISRSHVIVHWTRWCIRIRRAQRTQQLKRIDKFSIRWLLAMDYVFEMELNAKRRGDVRSIDTISLSSDSCALFVCIPFLAHGRMAQALVWQRWECICWEPFIQREHFPNARHIERQNFNWNFLSLNGWHTFTAIAFILFSHNALTHDALAATVITRIIIVA